MKNLIILPDGMEIYSGEKRGNNLRSATLKQCVNSETELTLGSVCAAILECTLQTPNGALNIAAGTEITLYKVDDSDTRHKVGLFTLEKPTRPSAHTYKLTAYDRISWLDKDLTEWLAGLDGWPYSVFDFAHMVAAQCGLTLKNTSLLNGDYMIRKFSGQGITGRRLMEWVGQICAKFCRATPDGEIEFAWYSKKFNIEIAPAAYTREGAGYEVSFANGTISIDSPAVESSDDGDGNVTVQGLVVVSDDGDGNLVLAVDDGARTGLPFFMNSLTYEDYETAPIEKVQIRLTEDDVGAVWPQEAGEKNTYIITGNYLLTTDDPQTLQSVAEGVYGAISNVKYTPCEVSLRANLDIAAGDIVNITDRNGKTISCYIMTMTTKGQRATLECTGSYRRDSSDVVNNETFKSLSGKVMEVRKSIEGLSIQVISTNTTIDDLRETVENYRTALELSDKMIQSTAESTYATKTEQSEAITNMMSSIITQTAQSLEFKFKEAQEYTNTVGGDLSGYKKEIESFIRNTSAGIEIGETGNPYSCLLSKDRLEFRDGGTVVAYISNSKLYITHLEVTGSAIIVGVEQKRRSNGNIIWRIRTGG